ncbi:MAG: 2-amino-4-hydroxy-6-hydroxymethyldihydropteridine diphosphokinase [Candidatus Omnitrophica bacterium]|nr:2-amino-4-hydroxy-6-hydroxymethyldihydropteridine diphosphokinase [Candidatus Omnitrophota bacterium]
MSIAYIAFGSNLGDRLRNIQAAAGMLNALEKVCIIKQSEIYETEPLGGPQQGLYLNGVWQVDVQLNAQDLMSALLQIEKKLGRVRMGMNAPRTIDLDILFYDEQVIQMPGLWIPHPRAHERWFVLKPMSDLCPQFRHPVMHQTVAELLSAFQPQETTS